MTSELRNIMKAEAKAWKIMMNGTEQDARTVYGEEGKNYIAWCRAADAERAYREKHDLVGVR